MVYVVCLPVACSQRYEVIHAVDNIIRRERHNSLIHLLIEFSVKPEPSYPAQPETAAVVEPFMEQSTGLVDVGGISRAEARVYPKQSGFVGVGFILFESVQYERVRSIRYDLNGRYSGRSELPDHARGDLLAGVQDHVFGFLVNNIGNDDLAAQLGSRTIGGQSYLRCLVEVSYDIRRCRKFFIEGPQEAGGRKFAGSVYPYVNDVLYACSHFYPASPVRHDSARIEFLPRRVDFHVEIDSGRSVKLCYDYSFGAVYNEFAAVDHHRHLAEIDTLLQRLGQGESRDDLEGHGIGEIELPALIYRVSGSAEFISDILQL